MVEVFKYNEHWRDFNIVGDLGSMPITTPMNEADYADLCAIYNELGGSYTLTYEDAEGVHERGGGGVAIDFFGRERPLTEEELLEQLSMPEVEYLEDGTVWVYYLDQSLEITDLFDENGVCFVQLKSTISGDSNSPTPVCRFAQSMGWKNTNHINPMPTASPTTMLSTATYVIQRICS